MAANRVSAPKVDVLAVTDATAAIASATQVALVRNLEAAGWQLLSVEIDVERETARIELKSGDLFVMFDARNGRATCTRERMLREQVKIGRNGDVFMSERINTHFVGRSHFTGLRSGLRMLSHYVADNSNSAMTHEQARNIFRPLLNSSALANIGPQS